MKKDNNKKINTGQGTKKLTRALAEISICLAIILGTLIIFFKLDDYANTPFIMFIDKVIPEFIYTLRTPLLNSIMAGISFFGNELLLAAAFVFVLLLIVKKHIKDAVIFLIILFSGFYFNLVLKEIYMRPRPDLMPLAQELTYSFPSGHSMNSILFYSLISYFIFRNSRNKKIEKAATIISAFLILGIGFSRIYLGVHYPSDVLAGFIAGLFYFSLVVLVERIFFVINFLRIK